MLAGNLDTQTVEHKQILGTDSELETVSKSGSLRDLANNYENKPKRKNYELKSTYVS